MLTTRAFYSLFCLLRSAHAYFRVCSAYCAAYFRVDSAYGTRILLQNLFCLLCLHILLQSLFCLLRNAHAHFRVCSDYCACAFQSLFCLLRSTFQSLFCLLCLHILLESLFCLLRMRILEFVLITAHAHFRVCSAYCAAHFRVCSAYCACTFYCRDCSAYCACAFQSLFCILRMSIHAKYGVDNSSSRETAALGKQRLQGNSGLVREQWIYYTVVTVIYYIIITFIPQ